MLGEPYFSAAQTPDGEPISKRIIPGQYKTTPNSVLRSTGEMFYYADPQDVGAKMGDLLAEFRQYEVDDRINPMALAAWFHYEFIRIHPFDDGNGRLGRILLNLILQRKGYVPAIIRVEEKSAYIDALAVADGTDDLTVFTDFIAKQVARTMDLEVRAANGEDISDVDDWKKELAILRIEANKEVVAVYYTDLSVDEIKQIIYFIIEIAKEINDELLKNFRIIEKWLFIGDIEMNGEHVNYENYINKLNKAKIIEERNFVLSYTIQNSHYVSNNEVIIGYFIDLLLERDYYYITSEEFSAKLNYRVDIPVAQRKKIISSI
jgi:fido (protein-threonine AMPylation protein)